MYLFMNYSIYKENLSPKIRICVGFLIRCNNCRDPTKSSLSENIDYINDGNKFRGCIVCSNMFISSPVFEMIRCQKTFT